MELLTPEDVLNKTFQTTKFRDGYDVEEVDDFLDLVLGTLRDLYAENEQLKAQAGSAPAAPDNSEQIAALEAELAAAREQAATAAARASEVEASAISADALNSAQGEADALRGELESLRSELASKEQELADKAAALDAATAATPVAEPEAAAGIISLAQQLHDDHVRQGQDEAARLVAEANSDAARIVGEAQSKSAQILSDLERDRGVLEGKIEDLKAFERDYRGRLESSLNGFLSQLQNGRTPGASA
ncbi:DivIVA domain-containing protein [Rarobacter faecitabidus]|uniref:Cell wall synthesis protein Wag31 n=1 Tax=Rarobacter faecitabidus TaxID=13243 RepID=A0A542ZWP3_RARFA|nr:DivIVA domain-containing protein [Rarobacter faecitabidus]TQL64610.1 DivIVA domain-containing protein [Rarobacter faecitabidus]